MAKNVLLTGGTGFVGKHLTDVLIDNGFLVSVLSRSDQKNTPSITYYKWDLKKDFIDPKAILEADYIIHLAGEGIVEKRWTTKRKKAILESRIKPIDLIFSILKQQNKNLDAFI
jgi:NAD dependent epimerase/dehydratase family enzyme